MLKTDTSQILDVLATLYDEGQQHTGGKVASYIPQLAKIDPNHFAVSVCFVNGESHSWGDSGDDFCIQSVCKPINYALALEQHGEQRVHQHVGFEPSGSMFNALSLNRQGIPHNPLINSGGIMTCSLLYPEEALPERFDLLRQQWRRLCGTKPGFDNAVYQSERLTAHRNFALAYFMQEHQAFPEGTRLEDTLELYFQSCSLTLTTPDLARLGALLAHGGTLPGQKESVLKRSTVRDVLTLMSTCGMYNYSGEFAFRIGLPAKSGVSGALMVVVPGLLGLAIWSPPLDEYGNTVRGVRFCQDLVKALPLHAYERWPSLPWA